ncbi:ABC transporter substrate-binding protein [Pseudoroseicyclus tamaricis]|uniref:Peptide ABC transporter substrate-binding protein n=1 Tax=Pseudoroseicyclus tamaricis TaxID=2705421 RepID=A0A6B2JVI8_9RHOB|nr:ABC transporter substrate-binding protein [Pseudoroseicyclus tamaricis]NDV00204.1 peptide ABC transporter substrate-binding protein [Pseudoroseicyclus tamaricis]
MNWTTNRRSFLKATGGGLAGLMATPHFAWAQEGDTLRIRMAGDFQVLDPWGEIGGLDDVINRCTTVTLVRISDMREGSEWELYAAESLEWQSDTALAFTLRDGLSWTNGYGPVTAEDVKYSFERIAGSDSAWAYQFEMLDRVEVTGERTGVIHLTQPFAPFIVTALPYYGGHLVSKAAVEEAGGSFTTEAPAECGPFLFSSWEQQQKVTLTANPDWTGEAPDFSTIEFYIVEDDQSALLAYEANSFDFTRVAPSSVNQLHADMPEGAELIEADSTTYTWLTVNQNAPTLQDPRVRRAIQLAYDSEAVLYGAYDGVVGRAAGLVPPGSPYARESNIYAERDVEQARALLAEAGAEGLTLNLVALTDSTSQTIAQIIQASLSEAGINVVIQPTEEAAYWSLGDMTAGDDYLTLELVLQSFAGGVDPTENFVWFRPDQIGVYNWTFFDSPEFEELYQASLVELDETARAGMFNRMEDLMEESGSFVFIAFDPYVAIHDAGIEPVILADGHPDPVRFSKE